MRTRQVLAALRILLGVAVRPVAAQDVWALAAIQVPVTTQLNVRVTGFMLTDVELRGGWAELRFRLTPWLTLTPALLRAVGTGNDIELSEWRPRMDASLSGALAGVRLTSRTMLERRYLRTTIDGDEQRRSFTMLRLRLRTELNQPISRVTPFAAAEYFRDLSAHRHVRSWVTAGVSFTTSHWQVEPAYLRRLEVQAPDGDAVQLSITWFP